MFNRKQIIAISIAFISVWAMTMAAFTQTQIKETGKYCNATQEDLNVALKYNVPSTDSGKCLMTCILKLVKMLQPDGLYIRETALTSLKTHWSEIPVADLETIADKCNSEVAGLESLASTNACEYGFKVANCINMEFKRLSQPVLQNQMKMIL